MRIDKFLAHKGFGSRKEVHELIRRGLVTVNGTVIKKKDIDVLVQSTPKRQSNSTEKGGCLVGTNLVADIINRDTIAVNGQIVSTQMVYYIKFHKPKGYVTTVDDPSATSLMELLPQEFLSMEVYPVGRLDKDTEGLILLTNDGQWAHRIIHGKKEVLKTYYVEYEGDLSEEGIQRIREGMVLGDGTALKPAHIEITEQSVLIGIQEGKYHQVKRMIGACGGTVTYLKRISVGPITLEGIEEVGAFTELSLQELESF